MNTYRVDIAVYIETEDTPNDAAYALAEALPGIDVPGDGHTELNTRVTVLTAQLVRIVNNPGVMPTSQPYL